MQLVAADMFGSNWGSAVGDFAEAGFEDTLSTDLGGADFDAAFLIDATFDLDFLGDIAGTSSKLNDCILATAGILVLVGFCWGINCTFG